MQEIKKTIGSAQARLNLRMFFCLLGGTMFAGFFVTALAWAIPKIWSFDRWMDLEQLPTWYGGWLLGGLFLGLLTATLGLLWCRSSAFDAAIEVDSRFGLKERLSSVVNLPEGELETPAGQALLVDATDRARRVDIRDQFSLRPTRQAFLPLIPLAIIAALYFVPDAEPEPVLPTTPVVNDRQQIEIAVEEAKQSLEERSRQLAEKGLLDAAEDLQALARKLDELPAQDADLKRDVLVKLNDVRDELEKKRAELGDAEAMKQNLAQLKEAATGPAQQLAEAISEGDFDTARKIVQELAKKIKANELTEQEKKNLAQDLRKLAQAAEKMMGDHEQAKQDLKEQIQQAQAQGDLQKAAALQEKLEQRQAIDKQIEKMKQAAENLKKCADCMGNNSSQNQSGIKQPASAQATEGNSPGGQPFENNEKKSGTGQGQANEAEMKQAQQALEDLAEQMEQMEADQDMLEQLEDLEQDLQDCKDGVNGCQNPGDAKSKRMARGDMAKGDGVGHGARALEETETGQFKSKVKATLQKGETVATGDADGDNLPGASAAEARELLRSAMAKETDPLEDQQLPRTQRDQAKQYFEKLRTGK